MSDFFVEQQWNLKVVFNPSFCHGNYENVKFYRFTKYYISIFSLAKFQLVSCNVPLAMIWQMTYTHKLPKLCSATLKGLCRQLHILVCLKSQLRAKQICLPSIISNVTNNKNELWKTVRLTSFQKTTIATRFNLLQVCFFRASFSILLCYLYFLLMVFFCSLASWFLMQVYNIRSETL